MNNPQSADQQCARCHGTGEINPYWPVGPGGARLSSYTCHVCGGTGKLPTSRSVMNSPADEAEARDRANTAPPQADPAARGRGETGASSGSEARPVTPTELVSSKECTHYYGDTLRQAYGFCAMCEVEQLRHDIERAQTNHAADLNAPETCGNCDNKEPCKNQYGICSRHGGSSYQPSETKAWQPIDTAPKDGREVLLRVKARAGIPGRCLVGHYMRGGHCIEDHPAIDAGWYFWNGCMFDKAADPLEWMALPPEKAIERCPETWQPFHNGEILQCKKPAGHVGRHEADYCAENRNGN